MEGIANYSNGRHEQSRKLIEYPKLWEKYCRMMQGGVE